MNETGRVAAMTAIVGEVIQALGEVPAGHLYAHVMKYMSWHEYNAIIGALKKAKMVNEKYNVLTWIGPKKES